MVKATAGTKSVAKTAKKGAASKRKILPKVVTLETTIHLSRSIRGVGAKARAPRACKIVRSYARKMMGTTDNRIDVKLNKHIWSQGIKTVPNRLRVRMARKVREVQENGKRGGGKYYTVITVLTCGSFKGKQTEVVNE